MVYRYMVRFTDISCLLKPGLVKLCHIKRSEQFRPDSRAPSRKETFDVVLDVQPPLFLYWPSDSPPCCRTHKNTNANLVSCIFAVCSVSSLFVVVPSSCSRLQSLPAIRFFYSTVFTWKSKYFFSIWRQSAQRKKKSFVFSTDDSWV